MILFLAYEVAIGLTAIGVLILDLIFIEKPLGQLAVILAILMIAPSTIFDTINIVVDYLSGRDDLNEL